MEAGSKGRSHRTLPAPAIPAALAAADSGVAVARICQSAGYHAAEPSALRALADVSARYLLALARAAASAANAGGRTDANLLDVAVALALEELELARGFRGAAEPGGRLVWPSAGPLRGLMDFVASVDEIPFARPVRRGRVPGAPLEPEPEPVPKQKPSFSQLRREPPFPHVPRWLPGFPDTWEGGQGRREGEKGVETEKGLEQLLWPPSDGKWTVEMERERRLLPMERARVRFRLGSGLAKWAGVEGEGGVKKRKMELSSAIGKALWKEGGSTGGSGTNATLLSVGPGIGSVAISIPPPPYATCGTETVVAWGIMNGVAPSSILPPVPEVSTSVMRSSGGSLATPSDMGSPHSEGTTPMSASGGTSLAPVRETSMITSTQTLETRPLVVEWPEHKPFRTRDLDKVGEFMFEALHALITQRPLLSLEDAELELTMRTNAYHVMGYPRDIWMIAMRSVWTSLARLHLEAHIQLWEVEVLPQIQELRSVDETLRAKEEDLQRQQAELQQQRRDIAKKISALEESRPGGRAP